MPAKSPIDYAKAIMRKPVQRMRQILRQRDLKTNLKSVSRDQLTQDLETLNLPRGAVVLVHSALKQLGYVEGGPQTVIDALSTVVIERRGGTLVLPTFSIEGTMVNTLSLGRPFDVAATPSNLGAIPEIFRRTKGVRRSVHPTHSFAALGDKADWIVGEHHLCGSNFGPGSPMARVLEAGGHLMGLGTTLGPVTFYHCLEDIEPNFPRPVYAADRLFEIECRDGGGNWHRLRLPAHAPEYSATRIDRPESTAIRAFVTKELEQYANLKWFSIGSGKGWVIPAQDMYAELRRMMQAGITIYTTDAELAALFGQNRL